MSSVAAFLKDCIMASIIMGLAIAVSPNTHKRPRRNTSKAATPGVNAVIMHTRAAAIKGNDSPSPGQDITYS